MDKFFTTISNVFAAIFNVDTRDSGTKYPIEVRLAECHEKEGNQTTYGMLDRL